MIVREEPYVLKKTTIPNDIINLGLVLLFNKN